MSNGKDYRSNPGFYRLQIYRLQIYRAQIYRARCQENRYITAERTTVNYRQARSALASAP